MLNVKNHILIVLATSIANVLEIKVNVVKFPFGKEKVAIEDLTDDDKKSVSFVVSSVNVLDKEYNLRNDSKGIVIDAQIGKTKTIGELVDLVNEFNEDNETPLIVSIPDVDFKTTIGSGGERW